MAWLTASWIVSIDYLVTLKNYEDTIDSARKLSLDYANCSNDFFSDLLQTVTVDSSAFKTDLLIWNIVLGAFCFVLWPTMFCANCKLVAE